MVIREATLDDTCVIGELIAASLRGLSSGDYLSEQVEAALGSTCGVDSQLLRDRTYFVIEVGGRIVAAGGWSFRKTLFGADGWSGQSAQELDPDQDAARIRAFFVHPDFARQGLGTRLLVACEQAAIARGFRKLALVATLPGVRLYSRHGYVAGEPEDHPLPRGLSITFVPMTKSVQ